MNSLADLYKPSTQAFSAFPALSHTLLFYVHWQQGGGAASTSSLAGSDNPAVGGLKSRARIQGSSDSGFIGSEEGKSPNTPSDR